MPSILEIILGVTFLILLLFLSGWLGYTIYIHFKYYYTPDNPDEDWDLEQDFYDYDDEDWDRSQFEQKDDKDVD